MKKRFENQMIKPLSESALRVSGGVGAIVVERGRPALHEGFSIMNTAIRRTTENYVTAPDARAEGHRRQVAVMRDAIAISRRFQGISMNLRIPVRSYQGVVLQVIEQGSTFLYRVTLQHRDPDLATILEESEDDRIVAAQWRGWARYFGLPALIELEPGDLRGGIESTYVSRRRRRNHGMARRRPRILTRRRCGKPGGSAIHRDEREIIAYE
jgi:hypothetical protein